MKRAISLLLAASMLTLAACDKKNTEPSPKPENSAGETDSAIDTPIDDSGIPRRTEPIYGDFTAEDFREIEVNPFINDAGCPVCMNIYDFTGVTVDPVMSPCKEPDERQKHFRGSWVVSEGDPDDLLDSQINAAIDYLNKLCDKPTDGDLRTSTFWGDKIYFVQNYDDLCDMIGSHCFSIMSLDIHTQKLEELYHYSDPDKAYYFNYITVFRDNIWLAGYETEDPGGNMDFLSGDGSYEMTVVDDGVHDSYVVNQVNEQIDKLSCIYRLNTDDNELEIMMKEPGYADMYFETPAGADEMFVFVRTNESVTDENGFLHLTTKAESIIRYDPVNKSWFEPSWYNDDPESEPENPILRGTDVFTQRMEDRKLVLECPGFRLDTGLRSATMRWADNTRIAVIQSDTTGEKLYVYDLEKLERYRLDLKDLGTDFYIDGINGDLLMHNLKRMLYVKPELGVIFELPKEMLYLFRQNADYAYSMDTNRIFMDDLTPDETSNILSHTPDYYYEEQDIEAKLRRLPVYKLYVLE